MCQETSNGKNKQKREIHKHAKIDPDDPGPYTPDVITETTPKKLPEKKKETKEVDST